MAFGVTNPYARRRPRVTATVTSRTAVPGQPQQTFAQQVMGRPPPSAPRPNTTQNVRAGTPFRVLPAPGGSWHLYNGQKVFVKANAQPPKLIQGTPGQPPVDPGGQLNPDAEYFDDRAAGLFKIRQQLDANEAEGTSNQIALRQALRQLEQQRPVDERDTRQGANKAGLFYSSELTGQLQDLARNYAQRTAGANSDFAAKESTRLANRQAIEAGEYIDAQGDLEKAAGRQITRETEAADAGYLVPEYGTPGTPARTVAGKAAPPVKYKTTYTKSGVPIHTYPTGRRVQVKTSRYRRRR